MAADNADNVLVGNPKVGGFIYALPKSATLPTNATTALPNTAVNLGHIGEDGLVESEDANIEKVKNARGAVVRAIQTENSRTFTFTLLESKNADVLKELYGEENVTVGAGGDIAVKKTAKVRPRHPWVAEMLDGEVGARTVIPDGQITGVGEINRVSSQVISYPVTLESYEDAAGAYSYDYFDVPDDE